MVIEFQDIHKHYGASVANRGISFRVEPGRIHGILGENGAGKSTLMKILSGYTVKTSGRILFDGRPVEYGTPAAALDLGIGMLYQEPLDFLPLTVLENFMLGQASGFLQSRAYYERKLEEWCRQLGFQLNPGLPVGKLTLGERQQLELLRFLTLGVDVLILDEPTTGISPVQKEVLFEALKRLASQGKTLLIVSHKLEDVEALCDRVTVLCDGAVAGNLDAPFDTEQVLGMMFGTPPAPPPRCTASLGSTVLSFEEVSATGGRAGLTRGSASFRRGEVVGLAGLEGSGQGPFLRLAAGLEQPLGGLIRLGERVMNGLDPLEFRRSGVTFLPTARLEEGLVPGLTLSEHFALAFHDRTFVIPWNEVTSWTEKRIDRFRIRGRADSPVESLSGGNQQRILLSLVPEAPIVLLLEQPTRGLDLESARWFWQQLQGLCANGTTILFSSAELDEILRVSHRVLVFYNGSIVLNVKTDETDFNQLGRAIAGKV